MKKVILTLGLGIGLVMSSALLAESKTAEDKPLPPNVPNSTKADDVNAVFVFNRVLLWSNAED